MNDPAGSPPEAIVDVLVEIPRGSRNKYEYDHVSGRIRLDRVLYSSVHYPADYGFIPSTLAGDGDPLDVLILVEEPTFPGCLVPARPVGVLDMADEHGEDHKILAVPIGDPRFDEVRELERVPAHWLKEIETFFTTYKLLQTAQPDVRGWRDRRAALAMIEQCREAYRRSAAADK